MGKTDIFVLRLKANLTLNTRLERAFSKAAKTIIKSVARVISIIHAIFEL
jgi:hypothetical protein